MRAPSIMQSEKRCFVTGSTEWLDCHHVYFGNPNRRISDENGFWVWLRHDVHMMLHARQKPYEDLDKRLKLLCQMQYMANGNSIEDFRALIGRSYL